MNRLQFLGHIITTEGTSPDLEKIVAVKSWPTPRNVKDVRSFLGLSGYYRRFIARYAQIAAPLTYLLKKSEGFGLGEKEEFAFCSLKEALISAPVLNYPNFGRPFQIDTDACEFGVRAVLSQDGHPLAYYSKKLSSVRQKASIYARELWAITGVVQKWHHYLLGHKFEIRTDHRSLKNL